MATKKIYYFGMDRVHVLGIPTEDFEELNKGQIAFYKACEKEGYRATIDEVRNCEKFVTPFDLKAYQDFQISQMSQISLCESERVFPQYQRRNCDLGLYRNSTQLIENEKQMSIVLRHEFYQLKEEILKAETKEAIDEVAATNTFASIADSFDFKAISDE